MSLTRVKNITADTVISTTTQNQLRIENTAANSLGSYMKIRDGNSTSGQHTWIGRSTHDTYLYANNADVGIKITGGSSGAGIVTKPNQPYFSVYVANVGGSGNPSSGAAEDVVPFDAAEFNVGNHFNTSTYRFTAPVDGVYQFNWNLSIYQVAVGSWVRQRAYKNGSSYKIFEYKYSQSAADQHFASSFAFKLDQNDYIEFKANSSDANFTYSAGALWNTCTGYLLG